MRITDAIRAWRLARGLSPSTLATKAGVTPDALEAIEAGEVDPTATTLEALAAGLGIPPGWLCGDPTHVTLLTTDGDGETVDPPSPDSPDPVIERILQASRQERSLFVLLTALLQSGDPKLLLAAEASLRSLVKQARRATVPWLSRPSGHFEPPSD